MLLTQHPALVPQQLMQHRAFFISSFDDSATKAEKYKAKALL